MGEAATHPADAREAELLDEPVTVTVVNYNGAAFLDACLDAALALRGRVVEVVVVDNASTDDSRERVLARGGRVRLVALDTNEGPCPARNRGLREARTRWVLQLDSDVIVPADAWLRLAAERRAGVAIVQPRAVLAHDPSVVHYDGGRFHYVGVMCLDHLLVRPDAPPGPAEEVDAVVSMALLVDREVVLEAGGYDEAFFILFEDHDLSYRLRARGHRLVRVPGVSVLHREGTAGISFRPGAPSYPGRRAFLHARNRAYLVVKNYGFAALVLTWPGRCVYALVWAVFAASRGVLGDYLRGRLDLLRLLPRALRERRRLARARRVGDRVLLGADDLTFSPVIARRPFEAGLEGVLNTILRGWWMLVRPLLPRGSAPAVEDDSA